MVLSNFDSFRGPLLLLPLSLLSFVTAASEKGSLLLSPGKAKRREGERAFHSPPFGTRKGKPFAFISFLLPHSYKKAQRQILLRTPFALLLFDMGPDFPTVPKDSSLGGGGRLDWLVGERKKNPLHMHIYY